MPVPSDNLRFLRKLPKVRFDEEPRGYSKAQVDRVLQNIAPIADSIEDLQHRLSEAEGRAAVAESRLVETEAKLSEVSVSGAAVVADERAFAPAAEPAIDSDFDQTLRNTLLTAQRTADSTVRDANEEAERMLTQALDEASTMIDEAKVESTALVDAARADRDSIAETVAAERRRLLGDVDREADQRRTDIEESLLASEGAERDRLLQEVTDLQQIRGLLAQDIDDFESHLVDRRAAVSDAISQLSGILDQVDGFGEVAPPTASEAELVDPGQFEAVSIGLPDEVEDALEVEDEFVESTSEGFLFGEAPASADDTSPFTDGETQMFEVVLTDDIADDATADDATANGGLDAFAGADELDGLDQINDQADDEVDWIGESDDSYDDAESEPEASVRPAWADSIPPESPVEHHEQHSNEASSGASDPFLDELRRATGDDGEQDDATDEALSRFLEEDDDSGRSGWFSRRK